MRETHEPRFSHYTIKSVARELGGEAHVSIQLLECGRPTLNRTGENKKLEKLRETL